MGLESAVEPSRLLHRRLNRMESCLRSINLTNELLTPRPDLDACLVRQLDKQVSRFNAEHSDLTRGISSLEHEDQDLFGLSSALAKTLLDLSIQIERWLSDQAAPQPTRGTKSGIKLSKMNVTTVDGDILKLEHLWAAI